MKIPKVSRVVIQTVFVFSGFVLIPFNGWSQTLPNPGFEDWVNVGTACENPTSWDSPNAGVGLFGVCSVFRDGETVQAGSAAVKMVTILIPLVGIRAPSAISNGILVVNASDPFNSTVEGGSVIWGRPDALTGFYRYAPLGGDSLTIRVRLFDITGADTTLISEDEFFDDAATVSYVAFNLPINYFTLDDAELAQVLIRSTRNTADATVGTTLWVDELRFTGITGVDDNPAPFGFTMYPNPASDFLTIENTLGKTGQVLLINRLGQQVLRMPLSPGRQQLDVSGLLPGIYLYRMQDDRGADQGGGKVTVLR